MEYKLSKHAQEQLSRRPEVEINWALEAINNPDKIEVDTDDKSILCVFKRIDTFGGRILKVVYRPGRPHLIITVHFDRREKGRL
jgi:hypothetical protein